MQEGLTPWAAVAAMPRPFVEVALVLAGAKLLGLLARRWGQQPVLGELLAGVLLGPAVLGWLSPTPVLRGLAEIGVVLLMFLAGLETNVQQLRHNAVAALWVALAGVLLPFAGGWWLAQAFGLQATEALFVGVLLVATSVGISAETLRELGWLGRREGTTVLAAAVYDDVLGLVALTLVLAAAGGPAALTAQLGATLARVVLFAVLATAAAMVVAGLLRAAARSPLPELGPAVAASAALLFAEAAEAFHLAGIVGAYLLGLVLRARGIAAAVDRALAPATVTFFTPFFFTSVGLLLPATLPAGRALLFTAALVVVAVLTKLVGCWAGALVGGFRPGPALLIGAAMVARGEVGLIVAAMGRDRGLISPEVYVAMAVVAVMTTLVTPPLIDAVTERLARREGAAARDG